MRTGEVAAREVEIMGAAAERAKRKEKIAIAIPMASFVIS